MMDKEFFEIANRLGACRLLHGTENKEELMRLLLTPQVWGLKRSDKI